MLATEAELESEGLPDLDAALESDEAAELRLEEAEAAAETAAADADDAEALLLSAIASLCTTTNTH